MKLYITLFAILITRLAIAQTTDDNYVKTFHAQVPLSGDIKTVNDSSKVLEGITYYDGLGRPVQVVNRNVSPAGKDLVTVSAYDNYGKNSVNYLPYASPDRDGSYKPDAISQQNTFYSGMFPSGNDGDYAFTTQVFEHSDLGRPKEAASPGEAWKIGSGHTITKEYRTNTTADSVLRVNYDATAGLSIQAGPTMYYSIYSLTCTKTIDEEGNDVLEFVDKEGRIVCKKVKASAVAYACTYYIYDDIGNLVTVIPPEGVRYLRKILNLN